MKSLSLPTLIPALAGVLAITTGAAAQDLQPAEIAHARQYLEKARDGVVSATAGLTPAQWNFKPAPDRWSVGEIVEHIVLAQELILGPVGQQLAKSPAPAADFDSKTVDRVVLAKLPDRSQKFQAPGVLKPTGTWTESAALDRLGQDCKLLIAYLESTPDLRRHILDAPPLAAVSGGQYKAMDGYEWLLTAAAHTERHLQQILEVKADPHFPAR